METKNSTTLFRFVALRKPEQLKESNKSAYFIYHPNQEASELYATSQSELDAKRNAFLVQSKQSLINQYESLYSFGYLLFYHRSSITLEDYANALNEYAPTSLSELSLLSVWDNYIYQIISHKDIDACDTAMIIIFANFIYGRLSENSDSNTKIGNTSSLSADEQLLLLRRTLQARVVCPTFYIFKNSSAQNRSTSPLYATNTKTRNILQEQLNTLENLNNIEDWTRLLNELKIAKMKYNKLENAQKKLYNKPILS